jgi:hypothetical protein
MPSIGASAATTLLLFLAGPLSCGLDTQGLLATDGGTSASTGLGDDASAEAPADEAGMTRAPAPDAEIPSDASAIPRRDASGTSPVDSGGAPIKDAATDAPPTCGACVEQMCPTQVAACGTGSDCLASRDCNVTCSSKGGAGTSSCSPMCQSKYPSGEAAFASLTLCALGCGAGCVAGLAVGTP